MPSNEREVPVVAVRNTAAYLSEDAFARYWKLLAWPAAVALTVLFFAVQNDPTFAPWREWVIRAVMFVVLSVRARVTYGQHVEPMVYLNLLAGVVLGLGCAILRLTDDFALYKLFSLLTVPAATGLLGAGIAWLTFAAFKKFATLKLIRLLPARQQK